MCTKRFEISVLFRKYPKYSSGQEHSGMAYFFTVHLQYMKKTYRY
jgi:hypothetical protein